jgi:Amt family ammonium transporter
MVAAAISFYVMMWRSRQKVDESLDVWACHGMGGTWGALATGIFASLAVNSAGAAGLIYGGGILLAKQAAAVGVVWVVAFAGTWILAKAVNAVVGLRVKQAEEVVGLDISQHGERAYGGL